MYRKNVASQFICFQMLLTATGAVATGLSPAVRRCIDGTFAAGGGTVTEDGSTGSYKYAMTQADTNGNDISFIFSAATAMPVCVNIVTTACDPTTATNFGITALPAVASGSAGAVIISGTGTAALSTSSGQVLLQTGTGTGQLSFTSGIAKVDVDTIKTNPVVNAGTITFPTTATLASTTNITAGTITTVTNLTNAPTAGDFTATMKASAATAVWTDTTAGDFTTALSVGKSLMNGVSLGTGLTVNDITTKTGYSLSGSQTFNMTGSITGSLSGSVGSVTGAVGSVTGNVGGNVVGSVASVTARVTANTDQINGVALAASNLSKSAKAIVRGTCSGGSTTTAVVSSMTTPASLTATGQLIGRTILFDDDTTTAALQGQASNITNSTTGSTPTITFTAMTTAPANTDTFSVV